MIGAMKKDWRFLQTLWMIGRFLWRKRRRVEIEVSAGSWALGQNGFLCRKLNGTRTFSFRVNGGTRETRMYVVDAAEVAGGFHKVYTT